MSKFSTCLICKVANTGTHYPKRYRETNKYTHMHRYVCTPTFAWMVKVWEVGREKESVKPSDATGIMLKCWRHGNKRCRTSNDRWDTQHPCLSATNTTSTNSRWTSIGRIKGRWTTTLLSHHPHCYFWRSWHERPQWPGQIKEFTK